MTEELRSLITALTCPHCNGGGAVRWQYNTQTLGVISRSGCTITCEQCDGDGLSPKGKELAHAHFHSN